MGPVATQKSSKTSFTQAYDAALLYAHVYGDQEMVQVLNMANHHNNINAIINHNYETALHLAVSRNYPILVDFLLQAGADAEVRSVFGTSPLMYAASDGYLESAILLLKAGAAPDRSNGYGSTPFIQAAAGNHLSLVKLFLDQGSNIDKTCNFGETALMKATRQGHVETALYLIERGAGLHFKNCEENTVLTLARENSVEIFDFICARQIADQNSVEQTIDKEPEWSTTQHGFSAGW